jgi:hypothetical protein
VIDATHEHLKLAKLEGDAAFFYFACLRAPNPASNSWRRSGDDLPRIPRRASDLKINTLCVCGATGGRLKIQPVGHWRGRRAKVKHLTELAGVDVILVHGCSRTTCVPVLPMTDPSTAASTDDTRRSAAHPLDLADLGRRTVLRRPRALRRRSAPAPDFARRGSRATGG